MTTAKYRIIVPDPNDGNPFSYVCGSLEELCFVYKFVEDYNLYLDVHTNVTVQRSRTQEELSDHARASGWSFLYEDDFDYWIPFTDEFVELTKAKTVRL